MMGAGPPLPTAAPATVLAQLAVMVPQALVAVRGSLTHTGLRDESLLLKTVLTEALGGSLLRPWRLQGVRDGTATLLGYAAHDAVALRARLAFALPALQQAVAVVATAPVPPLREGQRLRFTVRLVPTVRQTGKGEIDALLYAVRQAPDGQHRRAQVYVAYLVERLVGAAVQETRLDGTRDRDPGQGWGAGAFADGCLCVARVPTGPGGGAAARDRRGGLRHLRPAGRRPVAVGAARSPLAAGAVAGERRPARVGGMMEALVMRWRGPLMSLGRARIDGYAQQMPIPSLTMVAGMLAAALGYRRGDERLGALADALRYGVVVHQSGTPLVDFQTADLAAIGMWCAMVDRHGALQVIEREGSGPAKERQMQYRPLLADADMSVVAAVAAPWTAPQLLAALRAPAFPLCLGRQSCPPSGQVGERVIETAALADALDAVRAERGGTVYRPVTGLVDGLVVSVPSRGRSATLFAVM
jgi:CRISPR system Cascade subunit CasD